MKLWKSLSLIHIVHSLKILISFLIRKRDFNKKMMPKSRIMNINLKGW